jgi:parallel beta-helix repeat protein
MRKINIKIGCFVICSLFFIILFPNVVCFQENNLMKFKSININSYNTIDSENENILYVGGSGPNNFSKISKAIYYANKGDTVFVYSGTYYENVLIDKSIKLIGENKDKTIIDGQGKDAILCKADDIQIHGFSIKNGHYGIWLYYAKNNIISNNIISSNKEIGIWIQGQSHYTTITGNIIEKNNVAGLYLDRSDFCLITNNSIKYNPWDGIRLFHAAFNTISNNEICNNGYNGIMFRSSYENIVANNDFIENGLQIWQVYLMNNTIENNLVDGKPLIYLQDEEDKIINIAGQVILLRCNRITVKDLTIQNVFYAIQTYSCNDCLITNNILSDNFEGIYIGYDYPDTPKNIQITKNQITENQNGINVRFSENIKINDNIVCNNQHTGINLNGLNYEIRRNIIESNSEGFYISGSNYSIKQNIITNNEIGIYTDELKSSKISCNDINNNENGIYLLDSENNIISENNIYKSDFIDAFFRDSLSNIWRRNYWNKLLGPKIIFGLEYFYPYIWGPPNIIPVFNFDVRPSRIIYYFSI